MNVLHSNTLLSTLSAEVTSINARLAQLATLPTPKLTTPPAPGKWSVVQVLYHLQCYNQYYVSAIEQACVAGNSRFARSGISTYLAGKLFYPNHAAWQQWRRCQPHEGF